MRLASNDSFMRSPAPGGRVNLHTPLGLRTAHAQDADRVAQEVLLQMEKRLGRWPTVEEAQSGPRPSEDRTLEQRQARHDFKPKQTALVHPMQQLADELRESVSDVSEYRGLNMRERLALDAEKIVTRDAEQSVERKDESTRLAKLKPQLDRIDALIEAERWKAERGSMAMLDILEMYREQLVVPNADPEAVASRRKALKLALDERATAEKSARQAKMEALTRQIQAIRGGEDFSEVEPEAQIPKPDIEVGSQFSLSPEQQRQLQMQRYQENAEAAR